MATTSTGMTPQQIASYTPPTNDYLTSLLSGDWLNSNPYIDQMISGLESDAQRQFQNSILPSVRNPYMMGGTYGGSLSKMAEANAADQFTRGLMGQVAGIRSDLYNSERDRMLQGLGLLSNDTNAARGLLGGIMQSNIGAAASRYGANQAAGASRYGSNLSYQLGMQNLKYNYLNDLLNASQNYNYYTGGPPPSGAAGQPANPDPAGNFQKQLIGNENYVQKGLF